MKEERFSSRICSILLLLKMSSSTAAAGRRGNDAQMEFEAKSARDGAWYVSSLKFHFIPKYTWCLDPMFCGGSCFIPDSYLRRAHRLYGMIYRYDVSTFISHRLATTGDPVSF